MINFLSSQKSSTELSLLFEQSIFCFLINHFLITKFCEDRVIVEARKECE